MTLPDTTKKIRNLFLGMAAVFIPTSYLSAHTMAWWKLPTDYWLLWSTVFTGLGSVACIIVGAVMHCIYIDSLRSN